MGKDKYCLTHQTLCPNPVCRKDNNWAYLKYEDCRYCVSRNEVGLYIQVVSRQSTEQCIQLAAKPGVDARRQENEASAQARIDNKGQKKGGRR